MQSLLGLNVNFPDFLCGVDVQEFGAQPRASSTVESDKWKLDVILYMGFKTYGLSRRETHLASAMVSFQISSGPVMSVTEEHSHCPGLKSAGIKR